MQLQKTLQLIALASMLVGTLTYSTETLAQKKKSAPPQEQPAAEAPADTDKVDVTDIEQKYWASKDTDFSVVQNRLFPKANRFALSATAGPLVADPNSEGVYYALDASYYFSERWGIAATYSSADLQDNKSQEALIARYGARADHNKIKQFYGVSALWVPIYAKASFLNTKIVYFDFAISPGIGVQEYIQQLDAGGAYKSAPALTLDFTQQMFFSNHFALRADYRHRFYREEVANWRAPTGSTRQSRTETAHDQILTFGFTFYF